MRGGGTDLPYRVDKTDGGDSARSASSAIPSRRQKKEAGEAVVRCCKEKAMKRGFGVPGEEEVVEKSDGATLPRFQKAGREGMARRRRSRFPSETVNGGGQGTKKGGGETWGRKRHASFGYKNHFGGDRDARGVVA